MSFAMLKSAQEIVVDARYESPTNLRLAGMARVVQSWLVTGAPAEEVERMVEGIVAEKARIAGIFDRAVPMEMEATATVQEYFLEGLSLHHQACEALLQAIEYGDQVACESVHGLVDRGDRRIEEAESFLILSKVRYGYVPTASTEFSS